MRNNAFVLLTGGIMGGAERRFAQLFRYLSNKYPANYYFIITHNLYNKIQEVFPDYPTENLIPIGNRTEQKKNLQLNIKEAKKNIIKHPGLIKQVYRFINNYKIQRSYFREIEQIRKEKQISCFLGIFSGVLPLYFYLMNKRRNVGIIFCDMDSWFSDVLPQEKKYWYRKFSSFNFALENSDYVDFLSPFIVDGVKERGIKIKDEAISITPCSFTDYSKCRIGDKGVFQVAFSGRLEKDKNPETFLDAAIILSKKYPEIIFHIMGEGRLSTRIKSKVDSAGCTNIIFYGFHPQPTEILANTSVFVSIQTTNNYPSQSVLEAMGCGNAIIASDVGDTRMFINKDNGLLINKGVTELVNAIETLYLNKDMRDTMAKVGYSYVRENHTIDKMANYYINLFNKLNSEMSLKQNGN